MKNVYTVKCVVLYVKLVVKWKFSMKQTDKTKVDLCYKAASVIIIYIQVLWWLRPHKRVYTYI